MAYISVITDEANQLTKHFELKEDGKLKKTAPGHLVKGTVEAFDVNANQLITLIRNLAQNQCLCLGVPTDGDLSNRPILCRKMAKDGDITRAKEHLDFFPDNSWLLLDFDDSGKTPEEALELLTEIDPQFETAQLAVIPSSSSYLYNGTEPIIEEGNYHIFVELKGSRNPEEYGRILFDRLMLNGFMQPMITKSGAIIMKSMVDTAVMSPEREIFSADPICKPPLNSQRLKHIAEQEGSVLNSDLMPELDEDERMKLRVAIRTHRRDLEEKSAKQREKYYTELAKKQAAINGTTPGRERPSIIETAITYDKLGRPILELLSSQYIKDEDGNDVRVSELLLSPPGITKFPDPLEPYKRGDESKGIVGRGVATLLNDTMIFSHNHCGMIYMLRWTAEDVSNVFTTGTNDEKEFLWNVLNKSKQEMSTATTDMDMSDLADTIKLHASKTSRVGKEKKHVVDKLKVRTQHPETEIDVILDMNARFAMANMSGKATIITEKWNDAAQQFYTEYLAPASMDTLTKNQPMRVPGNPAPVSLYRYWEQHTLRKKYEEMVFKPNATTFRVPGKPRVLPAGKEYNLFQGYLYDPGNATSCDLILQHLKEVWCSNDPVEYDYVIRWLAHLYQFPERLSETALVLQSVPGTGKGIIIENLIVKPFGIHAMSTSNTDDLTGRFNQHLGMNIFFYSNEMSFTAQNAVKSMLKTVVETDIRTIEVKNVNKITTRNYTSLIFASNGDWVLNLDHGDRRYVYLTVSSHKVGDIDYFVRLKNQIDNGGKDAFITYLLNFDLTGFRANVIPNRKHKQRTADFLRSAPPVVKFAWSMYDTDFGVAHLANVEVYKGLKEWQDSKTREFGMTKSQLYSLYKEYCDYFRIERKFDDPDTMLSQLETGGVLRRETDPRDEFPMYRAGKGDKVIYTFKSIKEGKPLLRV